MTDPTPATPDEAVAALAEALETAPGADQHDHLPWSKYWPAVAADIIEHLPAGWSLSRRQGDTVAARVDGAMVERVADEMMDWRFGPEPFAARDVWRAEAFDLARRILGIGVPSDG